MVVLMNMKEWEEEEGLSDTSESYEEKERKCACGRAVCCGKHKGCCHGKKDKIRFIKERNKEL